MSSTTPTLTELTTSRSPIRRVEIWLAACREVQYKDPPLAKQYAIMARKEARKEKLTDLEIHAMRMEGICDYASHNYLSALETFQTALHRLEKRNNIQGMAKTHQNIGLTYRHLGQHAEALDSYERALVLARAQHDAELTMNVLTNRGAVYALLNRPVNALTSLGEALSISERIGDKSFRAYVMGNIADIYVSIGSHDSAIEWSLRSLASHRSRKDAYGIAMSLNNLGRVHRKIKKYDIALTYFTECLDAMISLGDEAGRARTLLFMAQLHIRRKRWGMAMDVAKQAQEVFATLNDSEYHVDATVLIGEIHELQHEYTSAIHLYQQCASALSSLQNSAKTVDLWQRLARVTLAAGGADKAFVYLKKALKLAEKSDIHLALADIHDTLSKLYESKDQLDKALSHSRIANALRIADLEHLHADHSKALEMRLEVERAERQREIAERESLRLNASLEAQARELATNATALGQQIDLLTSLAGDIRSALSAPSHNETALRQALSRIDVHLRTGAERKAFDERLAAVNEDFLRIIAVQAPSLSGVERKVSMLLRLELSSKEIGDILSVDTKTIEVYRSRIRKKLGLRQSDNLVAILQSFAGM